MRPPRTLVYVCPVCRRESPQPADVDDRYCGNCHNQTKGQVVVATWDDPWDPGTRPVQRRTGLGCSIVAHERLGWCCHCPDVLAQAEVAGWRYEAMDVVVPGYTGAVQFSRELTR